MAIYKKLIIVFSVLAGLYLFELTIFPEGLRNMTQMAAILVMTVIIIIDLVYNKEEKFRQYFRMPFLLIFAAIFLSMFMAYSIHGQSVSTTLIAQRYMYFYFFYFMLHAIRPTPGQVEKIVIFIGILYTTFYLLQYFIYPEVIFDSRVEEDRNTVRIFIPGFFFHVFSYFYLLNKFFTTNKAKYLILSLTFLSIYILMATRQVIFGILFLSALQLLLSNKVKSKFAIIVVMFAAVVPLYFIFENIFTGMFTVTEKQSIAFDRDIRVQSARFFLFDFQHNIFSYIFGNGADSLNASYGQEIRLYKEAYGFYQSDIGIIGDYSKFGVIFLIGVLIILGKVIFTKLPEHLMFIKYAFLFILVTFFTGGGPFGGSSAVVAISSMLYLVDVHLNDKKFEEFSKEEISRGEEKARINFLPRIAGINNKTTS